MAPFELSVTLQIVTTSATSLLSCHPVPVPSGLVLSFPVLASPSPSQFRAYIPSGPSCPFQPRPVSPSFVLSWHIPFRHIPFRPVHVPSPSHLALYFLSSSIPSRPLPVPIPFQSRSHPVSVPSCPASSRPFQSRPIRVPSLILSCLLLSLPDPHRPVSSRSRLLLFPSRSVSFRFNAVTAVSRTVYTYSCRPIPSRAVPIPSRLSSAGHAAVTVTVRAITPRDRRLCVDSGDTVTDRFIVTCQTVTDRFIVTCQTVTDKFIVTCRCDRHGQLTPRKCELTSAVRPTE